jgi:3-carboxy-cis,cis-muconate cycloisomerase
MPVSVLDSVLFRDMFGSREMRVLFEERAFLERCIETETALARAEAKAGLVPQEAAAQITACASVDKLDFDRLRRETEIVGYPILPLVRQLSEMCGKAGGYVHWGATTQDIMDTAVVLQCRAALSHLEDQLSDLRQSLRTLARQHLATITAGRTHLQHALPVTFGYRVAVWLSAFERHAQRLAQLKERVLRVQFGGAAGTLASLGTPEAGLATRSALADELGLLVPDITWHVARDGFCETVQLLALIGGSLGKIAFDVMIMACSEFQEVAEPFVPERGASSTMPQKRNPISSELILANARMLRERAALMLDAMVQDFERATGPWHLEWSALPESFVLLSGALYQANFMLAGLSVDAERMQKNLKLTGGLIVAEAVMMGLAPALGRQEAHDLVYDACRLAIEQNKTLYDVLRVDNAITSKISVDDLRRLTDPLNYLGAATQMAEAVLSGTT